MDHNIDVVIRVRPLIKREIGTECIWSTEQNCIMCKEKSFCFDKVFGQSTVNKDIYDEVGKPLVKNVMRGINGTLFAYGQTASGKTHTIIGEPTELGIVPLAIKDIFAHIDESPTREFLLRASYMEIYNEEIKDLLNSNGKGDPIRVRNNFDNQVIIDNLTEHTITTYENVMELIESGIRNRKTGATNLNERSSRSHCIFQLVIESRAISDDANMSESPDDTAVTVSQLNLVDLAGSERASQTGSQGVRFKESNYINTSLLTLGSVIRKLSENDKNAHIPYRDSKLTRILQHSLGGNAKTAVIATVSPVVYDETIGTLSFAERAKNVKNKPVVNEIVDGDTMLRRQRREISDLKKKIAELECGASLVHHTDTTKQKSRMAALLKQIICASSRKKEQSFIHQKANRRQTCCPSEFRMREQHQKLNLSFDIGEEFDDTTVNFEKLEFKLLQEEMQLEREAKGSTSGKLDEMKTTISEKDKEIESLLAIIEGLQMQITDTATLKESLLSLEEENLDLQETVAKQSKEIDIFKSKEETLVTQLEGIQSEKVTEDVKLGELESVISELKSQIQSQDNELLLKVQNITELTTTCDERGKELDDLRYKLESAVKSASDGASDIASLRESLLSLEEQNHTLQTTVEKQNMDINIFKSKEETLVTQLEGIQSEKVTEDAKLEELESVISELKSQIQSQDNELLLKVQNITELTTSCDEREKELEDLRYKLESAVKSAGDGASDVASLQDALQSLGEENEKLQCTIEKQVTELTILTSKKEDLTNQLQNLRSEGDNKKKQMNELLQESSQFVMDKETVLNELNSVRNDRDCLKEQLESLQCEVDKSSVKISDLECIVTQLKEQLEAKDDVLVEKVQYISNMLAKDIQRDADLVEKDQEICELKNKLETAQSSSSQASDIGTLKDVIESLGEENQLLQDTVDQKIAENISLITQMTSMKEEMLQKQEQLLSEISGHISEKEDLLNELDGKRGNIETHVEELSVVQKHEGEKLGDLQQQMNYLEKILSEKENCILALQEQIELLQKNQEVQQMGSEMIPNERVASMDETNDISSLKDTAHCVEEENQRLKSTIEQHVADLALIRSREECLNRQLEVLRDDRDGKASQIEQLLSESSQFVIDRETVLNELTNVRNERNDLKEQQVVLRNEMDEGRVRIDELQLLILQLKEKLLSNTDSDKISGQLEVPMDGNKENDSHIESKAGTINQSLSQEEAVIVEIEHLKGEIDNNVQTIKDLEEKIDELMEEKEVLLNQVQSLQTEKQEECSVLTSIQQTLIEAKEEIDSLKVELDSQLCKNNELVATIEEKNVESADLYCREENLGNELKSLRNENEELINQLGNLQNKVSSLDSELVNLLKELETVKIFNTELQSNVDVKTEECLNLSQLNEQLKKNIDGIQKEKENYIEEVNKLQNNIDQLKFDNENLSNELHELKNKFNVLDNEVTVHKNKNVELTEKVNEIETELDSTKEELSKKREELSASESTVKQLETVVKESGLKINEKDDEILKLQEKCCAAEENIEDKTAEIKTLKDGIISRNEDIKAYTERISEDEQVLQKLTSKLSVYKEKIENLTHDLKEVNKPCGNADIKDWNIKVVNLEKNNFELNERHQKLELECKELKEKEHDLTCCKETLEASNKSLLSEIGGIKKSLEAEKESSVFKLQKLKEHLKAKYEKILDNQRQGHARVEQGLETAYEKYKYYKSLYFERDAECEKYRVMLEKVSAVSQEIKTKKVNPLAVTQGTSPHKGVSSNILKSNDDSIKRKYEESDSKNDDSSKKALLEKDDGCNQQ